MGRPQIARSGLPGNRVDSSRAGITPRTRCIIGNPWQDMLDITYLQGLDGHGRGIRPSPGRAPPHPGKAFFCRSRHGGRRGKNLYYQSIFSVDVHEVQERADFGGFSRRCYAVGGSIFKAADCLALPAQSWYIRGVKQVISGKLLRPLGTVSTLKKWEEPEHG